AVAWEDETPACTPLLDLWSTDRRPGGPVVLLVGISGYARRRAGIHGPTRVRDLRGMRERPAVEQRKKMLICRYFSGSDGTRTRDLRRDRPVLVLAGRAGVGGDSAREQGIPTP